MDRPEPQKRRLNGNQCLNPVDLTVFNKSENQKVRKEKRMDFSTIANIGFLALFICAAGLGFWMWKKKNEEGE